MQNYKPLHWQVNMGFNPTLIQFCANNVIIFTIQPLISNPHYFYVNELLAYLFVLGVQLDGR